MISCCDTENGPFLCLEAENQSLNTEDKEMRMGEKGMRELKKRNEIQIDDERLANFPLFFVFLFEIFKLKLNNPFNP